jgi:hypothetical protein
MRLSVIGAALAAVSALAGPANAGLFLGVVNYNATYTTFQIGPPGAQPVVHFPGPSTLTFGGTFGGLLDSSGVGPLAYDCVKCLSYAVSGSSVTFIRLPAFAPPYGGYQFRLDFADDLGGNIASILGATIVGGSVSAFGSAGINTATWGGPVTGGVIYPLPEPASWALMIGGFALAGGALRRRKMETLRFA